MIRYKFEDVPEMCIELRPSSCPTRSDLANTAPMGGPLRTWQSPESVTVGANSESALKSMLVK